MAQAVQFFESGEESSWVLTTDQAAYVLGLTADGRLQHRYWGERLPYHTDYPGLGERKASYAVEGHILPSDEYPAWGGFLYTEPCLKATFADSVRDLVLVYSHHHQEIGQEGPPCTGDHA